MKRVFLGFVFVVVLVPVYAYLSAISIQTHKASSMQVFVNGKLYNRTPEKFVRIRSNPGLYYVQVKVLNPYDKEWYMLRSKIRVERGFEFFYKVVFAPDAKPRLVAVRQYPVYSRFFVNPDLYNRHPVS
ncbi:MAG: hypothetical protein N2044_07515 [Cyclobacteriaceae bacterium]|nr:hypothetical protein [Cyclobacteriaceae bacterium]MCX7637675.1 hypothetical protein [Cyclobacteriaceae bacterium]MDW8331816.1 hypothetical protein [Cyclobacteriaceae bacterium]